MHVPKSSNILMGMHSYEDTGFWSILGCPSEGAHKHTGIWYMYDRTDEVQKKVCSNKHAHIRTKILCAHEHAAYMYQNRVTYS